MSNQQKFHQQSSVVCVKFQACSKKVDLLCALPVRGTTLHIAYSILDFIIPL